MPCVQNLHQQIDELVADPVSRWKGSGPSKPLMCVITFRPAPPFAAAAAAHQTRLLLVEMMSNAATKGRSGGGERRRRPPEAGEDDKAEDATAAPHSMSLVRPIPASLS